MASHDPWLVAIAIFSATFVHEDLATIATGMIVADGMVGAEVALPALYGGIVLGDLGLYGLGRVIALNRFSIKFRNRESFTASKAWLDRRVMLGVFVVRFLPGLRLSAYVAYGFFAMPFFRFVASVILATSIWTTGLFYLSLAFGALTAQWLGYWRWPAVALAVVVPLFLLQRLIRSEVSPQAAARKEST